MSQTTDDVLAIPVDGVELEGELVVPSGATGIVVFAHGSGSSRHSPRNNYVAEVLRDRGLATLLFDLLTEAEDERTENRFDIERLTRRLDGVTDWILARPDTGSLRVGYFGSSTGAAGALRTAARRPEEVAAVVSRGGRVDLASDALSAVGAPTLFIVGGDDHPVLERNREALGQFQCPADLVVVPGADHLFTGPGELETVAEHAADWFERHLALG